MERWYWLLFSLIDLCFDGNLQARVCAFTLCGDCQQHCMHGWLFSSGGGLLSSQYQMAVLYLALALSSRTLTHTQMHSAARECVNNTKHFRSPAISPPLLTFFFLFLVSIFTHLELALCSRWLNSSLTIKKKKICVCVQRCISFLTLGGSEWNFILDLRNSYWQNNLTTRSI